MTDFTDKLNAALDEIAAAVNGGVDLSDLPLIAAKSMEVAEQLDDVTGEEKARFANDFACELIDRFLVDATPELVALVQSIDVPFLPEAIERVTFDPVVLKWAPLVVRAVVKLMLPALFALVISAAKGKLALTGKA